MTLLDQPSLATDLAGRDGLHLTDIDVWIDACALDDLQPDRGVAVLVGDHPVALFLVSAGERLFALGNVDPYSGASVMSRGIVGSIAGCSVVASPIFKQRFDLETGQAVDDPAVRLPTYAVRVADGRVLIGR